MKLIVSKQKTKFFYQTDNIQAFELHGVTEGEDCSEKKNENQNLIL